MCEILIKEFSYSKTDEIFKNKEAAKFFNNATEFVTASDRNLLSSISKNGKYCLKAVAKISKFIKTLFFGLNPEAIKKKNIKIVSIQ